MNSVESSTVVYSRLSSLDPESASKVMGFILIHGPNEADMMSLATAPDARLQQLIDKGKTYSSILTSSNHYASALHSSVSDTPSLSSASAGSPRFPRNGFGAASSPRQIPNKVSPSYASVVNGNSFNSASSSPQLKVGEEEEYVAVPDALSFLNDQPKSDGLYDLGFGGPSLMMHKRSLSVSDAYRAGEMNGGGGFAWRSSLAAATGGASSPGEFDGFEQEMLLTRARTQQQRLALASHIMSGNSFPYNNYTDSPRSMAAAMMMGEELHKVGQLRHDHSDIAFMGSGSSSQQIYLTFPADSTFREEDVSSYFSIYGPVQDVRIPYQQKRMFGFVTFVHPETVRIILAKGNPHFVCDSRVLVKPYKEKGKVEKKHLMTQQQQLERGDLSCESPPGVDIKDFDVRVGPRMFYNNSQDLSMRSMFEEQAEFQKALEMQSRKLASLQLLNLNNPSRPHPFSPSHNSLPAAAISSPNRHPLQSPSHKLSMNAVNQEAFEESFTAPTLSLPPQVLANRQMSLERYPNVNNHNEYTNNNSENSKVSDSAIAKSIDLVLPDTLDDAAPTRSVLSNHSEFSPVVLGKNDHTAACSSPLSSNSGTIVSSARLPNVAIPKSPFLDDPRFGAASGRAIQM